MPGRLQFPEQPQRRGEKTFITNWKLEQVGNYSSKSSKIHIFPFLPELWTKFSKLGEEVFFLGKQLSFNVVLSFLLLFSCSVVSNPLWPHELQHARLPCPSLSPRVCSNLCPLSQWCHPTISSSVISSSYLQSSPASGSFPMSRLFTWGGQSIGASISASVLPMNIQGWFPLGFTGFISLFSKDSQE